MFFLLKSLACISAIVVFLLAILAFGATAGGKSPRNFLGRRPVVKFGFFLVLVFLGWQSVEVVKSYLYPKDKAVFKNADYHLLEHRGFAFDSILYLVQDNEQVSDLRQEALWDMKRGTLYLTHDSMVARNFYEPLYCASEVDDECVFTLQNIVVPDAIEKTGLSLVLGSDTLTMRIEPYADGFFKRKKHCRYICRFNNSPEDTSTFDKVILRNYPLSEIVSHCRKLDFSDDFMGLLEGAALVRQEILARPSGKEIGGRNSSTLLFFPGQPFFMGSDVVINGKEISKFPVDKSFAIALKPDFRFFIGNGVRKSDVYQVVPKENKHVELLYVMPKMQKLRSEDGNLFITSSGDVAANTSLSGGYFYNIFEEENNANHINGKIKYFVGTSRDSMFFQVQDLYSNADKKVYAANEDFALRGRLKMGNHFQWIFQVTDLRATNSLQWHHFMIFIMVFISLVALRLLAEKFACKYKGKQYTVTFMELAVYVVAFCFGIVRLVLAWRMSTFVPYGDIGADAFAYLRNGRGPWLTTAVFIWLLPVALGLIAFFQDWLREHVSDFLDAFLEKLKRIAGPSFLILGLYIIFLALCLICGKFVFAVAFNIPLPVIGYFLFGWWMKKVQEGDDERETRFPSILLWICIVGYLAYADTGYAAIFLLCYFLYLLVICPIFKLKSSSRRRGLAGFILHPFVQVLVCGTLFYLCVRYEGGIIIYLLEHAAWFSLGFGVVVAVGISLWMLKVRYNAKWKRVLRYVLLGVMVLLSVEAVLDLAGVNHLISGVAESKGHMKYRAKVQQLKPDEHIDDLLMQNELNSQDVTFIMRSAHNQWFINQYADAYDKEGPAFQLKPHFQQGSSYTTQTTDLVVTRYVLAEHGGKVLFWLVASLLFLVIIYCIENPIGNSLEHRFLLLTLLLLYVTALIVFLSATNRIVFVGQDFPFLSITSRIAVVFPMVLFFIAILKTMSIDEGNHLPDKYRVLLLKWVIPLVLIVLSAACIFSINPMGRTPEQAKADKKQQAAQVDARFDVSQLISDISQKVEKIDKEFVDYQGSHPKKVKLGADSLWRSFLNDEIGGFGGDEQQSALQAAYADSLNKGKFFHTLLFDYFTEEQAHKDNPEELVHMRRRNGTFHLCVNKKHYSISSVMNDDIQWRGDILAAEKPLEFGFTDMKTSSNKKKSYKDEDYIVNILNFSLDSATRKLIPNISLSWFDTSWTDLGEPLLLVRSDIAKGSKEYFHVENEAESVIGSPKSNQIATRIGNNDVLSLNIMENGKDRNVITWMYGLDSEDFLARNLWINGRRQLFYPLGKESMWSYNFANLVSDIYGKDPALRNSSVRVSIDYQLHKQFYNIVKRQSRNVISLDARTVEKLVDFRMLDEQKKCSQKNGTGLYFDSQSKTLKSSQHRLGLAVKAVNKQVAKLRAKDPNMKDFEAVNKAIDAIASANFDYSAVVLDGNGRIRLLFDYDRKRNVDPNNITFLNRFLRELYMDGNVSTEREIFGNKAISLLVPGPGSSFKPIVYSAVTSQRRLPWESLSVKQECSGSEGLMEFCKDLQFYGGVPREGSGDKRWSLETYLGLNANNYILQSDNLYHSVIIMLGNQRPSDMMSILKERGTLPENFPIIALDGKEYSFNPDKWYANGTALMNPNSALIRGLGDNFRLAKSNMQVGKHEYNYFYYGKTFEKLQSGNAALRGWSFPESGSLNYADKHSLRKGFFQMALGANPLEVSPLQMACMGMRLVTLNRYDNLTTLCDSASAPAGYEFFDLGEGWTPESYIPFQRKIVFSQMRDNFTRGTARQLNSTVAKWKKEGYHFYAKTGTLNVTEKGSSRLKHLLVVISDKPLEDITSVEELRSVHYYVLYLSYIGIDKDDFYMANFGPFIDAVMKSDTFNNYMSRK